MEGIERAVAKLICIGFHGQSVSAEARRLIQQGVSSVVLFTRNTGAARQVAELNAEIKSLADTPVLVAVDQEGGRVMRLRDGFTAVPSMRTVGQAGDEDLARQVGRLLARELRAVNFDMDLAPNLDVDTNPENPVIADRSFGSTPELVTRMGCALLRGLQENGVAACGKHFPGHGDTSQDSHYELPRLPHAMARLLDVELPPFRAAVEAGVSAIMTSHVVFEPIDEQYPATMSRATLDGLLRDKMGFSGVVISDDLEMKAIANNFELDEVLVRGINAGVDLFTICHDHAKQDRAIEVLVKAVESGRVSRERIEQAGRRIDGLMARYVRPARRGGLEVVGCAEHQDIVERIRACAPVPVAAAAKDPTAFLPSK